MAKATAACIGLVVHDVEALMLSRPSTRIPTALGRIDAAVNTLIAVTENGQVVIAAADKVSV